MNKINVTNFISPSLVKIIRIVLGCIVLYSFATRLLFSWNKDVPAILYFTVQSNLLLGLYFILTSVFPRLRNNKITHSIALYMIIVGVIFILVLDEGFLDKIYFNLGNKKISDIVHYFSMINSIITHYLMPFIAFLDYIVLNDMRDEKLNFSFLIYPSIYFLVSTIFGSITGNYVYPFFNPNFIGGHIMLPIVMLGLMIIFIFTSKILYKINCRAQTGIEKYYNKILDY